MNNEIYMSLIVVKSLVFNLLMSEKLAALAKVSLLTLLKKSYRTAAGF
jgi:hypothetical protein